MLEKLFDAVEHEVRQYQTPMIRQILMAFREKREEASFSTKSVREKEEILGGMIVSVTNLLLKRLNDVEKELLETKEKQHDEAKCFCCPMSKGSNSRGCL